MRLQRVQMWIVRVIRCTGDKVFGIFYSPNIVTTKSHRATRQQSTHSLTQSHPPTHPRWWPILYVSKHTHTWASMLMTRWRELKILQTVDGLRRWATERRGVYPWTREATFFFLLAGPLPMVISFMNRLITDRKISYIYSPVSFDATVELIPFQKI